MPKTPRKHPDKLYCYTVLHDRIQIRGHKVLQRSRHSRLVEWLAAGHPVRVYDRSLGESWFRDTESALLHARQRIQARLEQARKNVVELEAAWTLLEAQQVQVADNIPHHFDDKDLVLDS